MREILFRGKTADGKWIDGFLFQEVGDCVVRWCITRTPLCANDYSEIMGDYAEVIPETVGQYTGLTDKNGKKIFEDDIVKVTDDNGEMNVCSCGIGYVLFYDGVWYIDDEVNDGLYDVSKIYYIEVIGNIHDNPELFEGGK